MKRNKKLGLAILIISLFLSFILLFYETLFNNKVETYQISVIVNGKSDESLMILKEGTEQAAIELNANIRFIFLSQDNDYEEQIDLIKRESKNKVDGILLLPIENEEVIKVAEEVNKKTPVILIQSLMEVKSSINKVVCNEYELGNQLAVEALNDITLKDNILIVYSDFNNTCINERYNGVVNELNKEKKIFLSETIKNNKEGDDYKEIKEILKEGNIGAIISLDTKTSEYIGEAKKRIIDEGEKIEGIKIYTVGSTNKIISLLEEGIINATAIQNEFNVGYIGVEKAINIKNGQKIKEENIKSTVVTSDNMYCKENERILFLFIR